MKLKKFLYSEKVAPYIFVIPFILSFAFFWIYPLITSVTMSFQDIGAIKSEWVGLANYQKLLKDNVFHTAIWNSTKYMLFTLVLLIPFPMLFAVLMDSRLVKAKGVWKAILYMPALTSVVISGTLFRLMFTEYSTGQMNIITAALGLGTYKWLKMGWSGMTALLVVACWRWTGVNMLYFLSGLKAIDSSLYEASEIDGASAWHLRRTVRSRLARRRQRMAEVPLCDASPFEADDGLRAHDFHLCRTGNVPGILHVMGGQQLTEQHRTHHRWISV